MRLRMHLLTEFFASTHRTDGGVTQHSTTFEVENPQHAYARRHVWRLDIYYMEI